jgi:ribosomal-protein-alanine N-acetyltransferase
MPEGVQFAKATRADVDAIHRIEEASFPAPWRRDFFVGELMSDGRFNIVAKRDGVVIGYLFSMWIFDEMHINKIAVIEGERRKGIADALMDACFRFARERDVKSIVLEVRKSNKGAQEFYKHLDFKSSYIRPRYYPDGEAAVVMIREMA